MSLKVIAGEFGGRNLQSVKGVGTRPLLGQVREALFNILGDWVRDKEVWDLFAGTGASGLEALSRGARRVFFVEKSNQALKVLRANIESLGVEDRSVVIRGDAWRPTVMIPSEEAAPGDSLPDDSGDAPADGEAECVSTGRLGAELPADLIFLDPPYKAVTEDPSRAAYLAQQLLGRLAPGGMLCFHFLDGHLDRDDFDPSLTVEIRRWGKSAVALIEKPGTAGHDSTPEGLIEDTAYEG